MSERSVLAPTRHPPVDEARVAVEAHVGADPESFGDAGTEPLDQRVGTGDEVEQGGRAVGMLEVDRDVAPTAQQDVRGRGVGRRPTHRLGALDPDHLGTHVGEQHRRERAGADAGQLDDADAVERAGHRVVAVQTEAPTPADVVMWLAIAFTIFGHNGSGRSWPMSASTSRSAPGINSAVRSAPLSVMSVSSRPWMTSVGTRTSRSCSERSPLAQIAGQLARRTLWVERTVERRRREPTHALEIDVLLRGEDRGVGRSLDVRARDRPVGS